MLFPIFGFQIITERSSLEDLPCPGRGKLSIRRLEDGPSPLNSKRYLRQFYWYGITQVQFAGAMSNITAAHRERLKRETQGKLKRSGGITRAGIEIMPVFQ